jgi:hypothetical protein
VVKTGKNHPVWFTSVVFTTPTLRFYDLFSEFTGLPSNLNSITENRNEKMFSDVK